MQFCRRRHDAFSPFISLYDEYQKMTAKKRSKQSGGPRQSGQEDSGEAPAEVRDTPAPAPLSLQAMRGLMALGCV
jgi:hypothetical protein